MTEQALCDYVSVNAMAIGVWVHDAIWDKTEKAASGEAANDEWSMITGCWRGAEEAVSL